MSNINDQKKETELLAKFPYQRAVLILLSAVSILFGGLMYLQRNAIKETRSREKESVAYWQTALREKNAEVERLTIEKDSCNEGKVMMITQMLNRELAIKLSKDTTQTVKKIVESLVRASELKEKQSGGLKK